MYWGRTFKLYGPRPRLKWWEYLLGRPLPPRPVLEEVLPCDHCGTPIFAKKVHVCEGRQAEYIELLEQDFERKGW